MSTNPIRRLVEAEEGHLAVLQGNIAFAVGCVRGGVHAADGYPGTPSTEVIDKGLSRVMDRLRVGWSVNEANAVALALGATKAGDDAVVTLKIPGLFQAGDVVASTAGLTPSRGGLVLFIASDFVPSSTQHVIDPRYFLKSCMIPILEPRTHQEMLEAGPRAAAIARSRHTVVAILASGLLCHSEGLVRLPASRTVPRLPENLEFKRFMNLPRLARESYDRILAERMPALRRLAEETDLTRIEWADRTRGVVVHGVTELGLREVLPSLPSRPSILSLGMTYPLPRERIREFVDGIDGEIVVLGDGLRFVQEELLAQGHPVTGKEEFDSRTEWSTEALARRLGADEAPPRATSVAPVPRPPNVCAGCPYRAFGLVVQKLRKRKLIVGSFGDIGCNTLLFFLNAIDSCTCMGASDAERQGLVLADPSLADKVISVVGDSTECHSGLDATRNAIFRNVPGVKVIVDNATTAMTGGQPAPSSPVNLDGAETRFDLVAALEGEGARVVVLDAYDMKAIETSLRDALERAASGEFSVLVVRGPCMHELPAEEKHARFAISEDVCKQCYRCQICPGIEVDERGYPRFTQLCTGCGGHEAICVQQCVRHGIRPLTEEPERPPLPPLPALREEIADGEVPDLPPTIRLAVRGVGGQGNLFLGKVLAEVALRAGFTNVVKGETHGMAQLGGPVVSTFGCGDVHSPAPAPGSVDVLVVLERSEVLRPGFIELLKPGGSVLLNRLRIVPAGVADEAYPTLEAVREHLRGCTLIEFDALAESRAIGDTAGWTSNVVALGLLTTVEPFSRIPQGLWQRVLLDLSPGDVIRRANLAAFARGREITRSRASREADPETA